MVLATQSVMSRPWCLAEIYCAAKLDLPVVLVTVEGGGFDLDKTVAHLSIADDDEYRRTLEAENAGVYAELARILAHEG